MREASDIIGVLQRSRLPVDDEKVLQEAIADVLADAGIAHQREVKVTGGVIDILADGVGIEIKISGSKRSIYRQCAKYCADPRITHLVVAASAPLALPDMIAGKPVTVLSLGRAWL